MRRPIAVLVLLLAPVAAAGEEKAPPPAKSNFWTDGEMALLDRGLETLNVTRADMGFQKRPIEDPFRLPVVNRALDDPLSVGDEAQGWDDVARSGSAAQLLDEARRALDLPGCEVDIAVAYSGAPSGPLAGTGLPDDAALDLATLLWRSGLDAGSAAAAREIDPKDLGPFLSRARTSQREESVAATGTVDMEDARFLGLVRKWDVASQGAVARSLLGWTGSFVAHLRAAAGKGFPEMKEPLRLAAGAVVIYGPGDDVHASDANALLVVDLGGNDTWTRGASVSPSKGGPVAIAVDLSGNDRYVGREDPSFGAALGGVAIQWDCGSGDDVYEAGHASLGAGICGVGVLVDEGGDDVYRCRDFGLGAGAFGIGLLLDKGGNDLYHCDLYGEGFASTRGCGVLVDMEGNDVYDAGGAHVDVPLYTDRYQSLSQGFSIGMRPDASGGVGVLVDLKGNDRYSADIYGQGASYWYSLGILVDDDGNDTYCLGQYGQGSGIHLSAGILVDRAGSDLYYLKNGVGMGGAHDYSVGMLVDRGGDDYYAGSGGSQGGALTNSVALLFDDGGKDAYAAVTEGSQGYAAPARGTGGIGLLLDAGGDDVYTEKDRDGGAWTKELMGAGLDEPSAPAAAGVGDPGTTSITPEAAKAKVDADGTATGPDGKPVDDLDALWKMASEWEVGDNRVIVPIARERLVALGKPALDRALERVGDRQGLEYRACEVVFSKFPADEVVPRLVERTRDADRYVRRNSVLALAGLKAEAAMDRLLEMLEKDPETRGAVLGALSALKKAPPVVKGYLKSPKEPEGVQATACLAAVGDEECIAALCGALGPDHSFPVRIAAMDRLAGLGEKAVAALAKVASDDTVPVMVRRNALRALGRTKSAAAAAPLVAALASPDRLVRLSAFPAAADLVKGLGREASKDLAAALAAAREKEQDPLVKRMR